MDVIYIKFDFSISMMRVSTIVLMVCVIGAWALCPQGTLPIHGECLQCEWVIGCIGYGPDGKCTQCQYGLQLEAAKCVPSALTPDCCASRQSDGTCTQCARGLILEGNSCYRVERIGCLHSHGLACDNCAHGYYLHHGNCYPHIQHCLEYNPPLCSACHQGYQLADGVCVEGNAPLAPECLVANAYGCVKCIGQHYLTTQHTCRPFPPGCLHYVRQKCSICQQGWQLVEGQCQMPGCLAYGSNGCQACSPQYQLNAGVCVIDGCLKSYLGKCLICDSSSRLSNGKCVPPSNNHCLTCAQGFMIGEDGKCYEQMLGCQRMGVGGSCGSCRLPFILSGGRCVIAGCTLMGANGCTQCASPYSLTPHHTCAIDHCLEYDGPNLRCLGCEQKYHLHNSLCVENEALCESYRQISLTTELCSSCHEGYILNHEYKCMVAKAGCVYQDGLCISCHYPFVRVGESCAIEGCAEYNKDGCRRCSHPYENRRGNCIIPHCQQIHNHECRVCAVGFHPYNSKCAEDDPKCRSYYASTCVECVGGYVLDKWQTCVRGIDNCGVVGELGCEFCNEGYKTVNGACIQIDAYCHTYQNNKCVRCQNGYHLHGQCVQDSPHCAKYSAPPLQLCIKCKPSYALVNHECQAYKLGCIYEEQKCVGCRQPFLYEPSSSSCQLRGCAQYEREGCSKCVFPFLQAHNHCYIEHCALYEGDLCDQCQEGYSQIQGRCYKKDPKCLSYLPNAQCQQCIPEYKLFEGVCVREDARCSQYSRYGGCLKCAHGYYTSTDRVCLPKQPGCIYQQASCTHCTLPFTYVSGRCEIEGCLEAVDGGCRRCRYPFQLSNSSTCAIPYCSIQRDNKCVQCEIGYHEKEHHCQRDDQNCLSYKQDGDCEDCAEGYLRMSSGECQRSVSNCVEQATNGYCVGCKDGYFLNRFYQCEAKDVHCEEYNNGVCVKCDDRHFLYEFICFPYSKGCVEYEGKNCVQCKKKYSLKNGECFLLKKPLLTLDGQGDKYDFDITPIDITKSKYYIDNLSPISHLAQPFYSSFWASQYKNPLLSGDQASSYGWKAENQRQGEYIGYSISSDDPLTFYALQLEAVSQYYVTKFYLEYSIDGVSFIRVQQQFSGCEDTENLRTIYFTGLYARAIRIVIIEYEGWPATKIEFFYYDNVRHRKISNLKSLRYLKQSIEENFVNRIDNQIYINQRLFSFAPENQCKSQDICFTGLELCQPRIISGLTLGCLDGAVESFFVKYSLDGTSWHCFQKCRQVQVNALPYSLQLHGLLTKNLRVFPVAWQGTPRIQIAYHYD